MNTQTERTMKPTFWPGGKWRALRALWTRFRQTGDQSTDTELARLAFWRWLYRTGQRVP